MIIGQFPQNGGAAETKYKISTWNDGADTTSIKIGSERIAVYNGQMVTLDKQYSLEEFFSKVTLNYNKGDPVADCIEFTFSSANKLTIRYGLGV